jgi:tetratricopeptide (TPR) repeat protein
MLAFEEETPPGRVAIGRIGAHLAEAIFPSTAPASEQLDVDDEHTDPGEDQDTVYSRPPVSGRDAMNRALKQIDGIAQAVAKGKDRDARRFLDHLIREQSRYSATQHALKSLCNIAQRCADMFRPDFERVALEEALRLKPDDPWTLIQWGNHLKGTGAYDAAIEVLERALGSANDRVCLSSMADVWCERGEYDKAVEAYKRVPNWSDYVEVRTGLADVLRKQGRFPEAEAEYDRIRDLWPEQADRALAGKAEIAKRQGRLDEAIRAYESLLGRGDVIDDRVRLVYRMAKCNVLKQKNRLQEAYQLADEIVSDAPFLMAARVSRASILGLLGEEEKGLRDIGGLCSGSTTAYEPATLAEWFLQYFRGLLLLKADRYQDAKRQLVSEFKSVVLTGDYLAIMRLGAAFTFLSKENISEAARVLADVGDIQDCFTRHIRHVLQLHVAVAQSDTKRVESISRELQAACVEDESLQNCVRALSVSDFDAARTYEIELLLRIAA